MIIDTSAIIAILFDEEDAHHYADAIAKYELCRLSVANQHELVMVLSRLGNMEAIYQADRWIERQKIIIEPVTLEQATEARKAFLDFGKGRHPAGLNYGDCFAYALAATKHEPLLFKGNDFAKTDISPAANQWTRLEPLDPAKIALYTSEKFGSNKN